MIIESTFNVNSKNGKALIATLENEQNRLPLIKENGNTLEIEEIAYYNYERETSNGLLSSEAVAFFSTDGLIYTTSSKIAINEALKLIFNWEGETLSIKVSKQTSAKGFNYLKITKL